MPFLPKPLPFGPSSPGLQSLAISFHRPSSLFETHSQSALAEAVCILVCCSFPSGLLLSSLLPGQRPRVGAFLGEYTHQVLGVLQSLPRVHVQHRPRLSQHLSLPVVFSCLHSVDREACSFAIEGVDMQLGRPSLNPGFTASSTSCFTSRCLSLLVCKMEIILPTSSGCCRS